VKLVELNSAPSAIFATFSNEEAKQRALKLANGFEYRQKNLVAHVRSIQI